MAKRPQNQCKDCGYTWYPKGKNLSPTCPQCKSSKTEVRPMGCVSFMVLGTVGFVILGVLVQYIGAFFGSEDSVAKEMQRVHDQMRKDSLSIKGRKPLVHREITFAPWDPAKVKISAYPKKPYAKRNTSKLHWESLRKDSKQIQKWHRDYIRNGTLKSICERTEKQCQQGGRCFPASRILCRNQHRWRGRAWWTRNTDEQVSMVLAEKWTHKRIRKWLRDYPGVIDALRRLGYDKVVFSTTRDVRRTHKLGWHHKPWFGLVVELP